MSDQMYNEYVAPMQEQFEEVAQFYNNKEPNQGQKVWEPIYAQAPQKDQWLT